ncbi:tetratricopeptide repeat protein [Schaalia suimastitidis]|uniref:tetratricopeptide repeat protein n=1 Tax=Schaalia suimastitidis TaxID=121163 RepID=UPI00068442F3|nr:hypothetical protein [Schaalia suimastitidis]
MPNKQPTSHDSLSEFVAGLSADERAHLLILLTQNEEAVGHQQLSEGDEHGMQAGDGHAPRLGEDAEGERGGPGSGDDLTQDGAGNGDETPSKAARGDDDESDDFYNDMEGEEDLIAARATRRMKARRHAPVEKAQLSAVLKFALFAAVACGMIAAIWLAGISNQQQSAETASMTQQNSASAIAERLAQLHNQVERSPNDTDARLELGALLYDTGDVMGAQEQWKAVTDIDPEQYKAWYFLGFTYMMSETPDEAAAVQAWQKVIELAPESAEAQTVAEHMSQLETTENSSTVGE